MAYNKKELFDEAIKHIKEKNESVMVKVEGVSIDESNITLIFITLTIFFVCGGEHRIIFKISYYSC